MNEVEFDLAQLIEEGRHASLDWLQPGASDDTIAETIMAMANSAGGKLLLGIDGTAIIGVTNTESAINQILQASLTLSPPLIMNLPRPLQHDNKSLILAHIPDRLPHVYAYQGRYLSRDGTKNQPIPPRDLHRLMIERGTISYEAEITPHASLDDIDWNKAETYVKGLSGVGSNNMKEILFHRGCLAKSSNNYLPTNAGILLFGKNPGRFIRGSEITAVRFAGDAMVDTFNRQDITGTLPDQIQRAETFLVDHLRKAVTLKGTMARQEDYEYPMEAVRELVVNAVAHRDYSIQGDNIRVFIFSNHMEVHSPGTLPGPMTVDNLKDERFSRNPIIVQILSDMGFIERLGYGVDRVIELMASQGLETPEFIESSSGFRVTVYNRQSTELIADDKLTATESESPAIPQFNGRYKGQEINPRQESALSFLYSDGNNRITNSDLSNLFPDVHQETIRRDLVDLVNKNILQKMGQKRGSYYILKETIPDDKK